MFSRLVGWLVDWLVGWLVGCLVDWLVGWLFSPTEDLLVKDGGLLVSV